MPITVGGGDEVDLHEPRGAGEERVHRDLDPGRENAADVLPVRGDDVEVRGRAEVDDDARRAVALARGDRVDDPVGPDLARIVVEDRDAGLVPGPDDEERRLRVVARELLVGADERRHGRGEADAADVLEAEVAQLEQPADEDAELVAGALGLGGDAPVLGQALAVVEPETVCVLPTSTARSMGTRPRR